MKQSKIFLSIGVVGFIASMSTLMIELKPMVTEVLSVITFGGILSVVSFGYGIIKDILEHKKETQEKYNEIKKLVDKQSKNDVRDTTSMKAMAKILANSKAAQNGDESFKTMLKWLINSKMMMKSERKC